MSGFIGDSSSGGGGNSVPGIIGTVWSASSTTASSVLSNGIKYTPLRDGQSDTLEFQFVAQVNATIVINILYYMSTASGNAINLQFDRLSLTNGSNPAGSLTSGTPFSVNPGNDTNMHTINNTNSSSLSFAVLENNMIYCKLTRDGSTDTHSGDMRVLEIIIK